MGAVYKARQISMDRIVALKVLNERFSADQAFVERFIREAQAAGQVTTREEAIALARRVARWD